MPRQHTLFRSQISYLLAALLVTLEPHYSENLLQHYTVSVLPTFLLVEQLSVPNFEKGGSEKNECLEGLKEFLP